MKTHWWAFLGARKNMIHEFYADGKSDAEITKLLSMDSGQVHAIRIATKPNEYSEDKK